MLTVGCRIGGSPLLDPRVQGGNASYQACLHALVLYLFNSLVPPLSFILDDPFILGSTSCVVEEK